MTAGVGASDFLAGGGKSGELMRAKDWASTPLGPTEGWPQSLRTSVSTCLNCSFPILVWWGPELVKLYNDAYAAIIAAKLPRALGAPGRDVWPEIWETVGPMLRRVMDHGEAVPADDLHLVLHRHGYPEDCYFSFSYSPIRDETGRVGGVFCPVIETTPRVLAERRSAFLLAMEPRLRAAADPVAAKAAVSELLGKHLGVAQAGYCEVGTDGDQVVVEGAWNDEGVASANGVHRISDYGPSLSDDLMHGVVVAIGDVELDPRTSSSGALQRFSSIDIRAFLDVPLTKAGRLVAFLFLSSPSPRRWTDYETALLRDAAERTWAAVERTRVEQERERLVLIVENSSDFIGCCDAASNPIFLNRAGRKLVGLDPDYDITQARIRDFFDPEQRGFVDEVVLPSVLMNGRWVGELTFRHLTTGEAIPVLYDLFRVDDPATGTPINFATITRDITERKRVEESFRKWNEQLESRVAEEVAARQAAQAVLAHAQRMEALGQLAGGIAHDFNNVVQAVQGGAALIERRPQDAERVRSMARLIIEAAGRGAAVTRRLLAFSRRSDLRTELVDTGSLLSGMQEILMHTLGAGIVVRVKTSAGVPPLLADKGQLETVLINLATNARDAMRGAGTLTLAGAPETLSHDGGSGRPVTLKAGSYVRLSISDTGCGMSPEVLAKASEPFFTTKEVGAGTGLGLAMARGFAEQSGGGLHIESAPGLGATVKLWFPVASGGTPRADAPSDVRAATDSSGQARAIVLIVDDDALVRETLAKQMEAEGFAVLTAPGGPEALALIDDREAIDLLVADLSMPGMDGMTLVREAHRRKPLLPTVLLTGFATDAAEIAMSGAMSGAFSLSRKPIDGKTLAERIAVMLESVAGGAAS